jgi:hypothetical protein
VIEVGQLFVDAFFIVVVFGTIGGIAWKVRKDDVDDATDMRSVPLVRIADVRDQQMVRLAGRVVTEEGALLDAPVSGRPCVAFGLQFGAHGKLIIDRNDSTCFVLEDGSGLAHVVEEIKIPLLATRMEGTAATSDEVPATLAAWLEENHASDEWRSRRDLHWLETRVEPGDEVAVVGIAHVGIDVDGDADGYRDAPTLITIESSEDAPLSLSDDPSLRRA